MEDDGDFLHPYLPKGRFPYPEGDLPVPLFFPFKVIFELLILMLAP